MPYFFEYVLFKIIKLELNIIDSQAVFRTWVGETVDGIKTCRLDPLGMIVRGLPV